MVKSRIKPEIQYTESKKIDAEDIDHETSVYEAEIFGKRVVIGIGKIKYTYTGKGIVFYPVYLITNDVVKSQIGVFEMSSSDLPNYLEEETIDIELFVKDGNGLLLYSFLDKDLLERSKSDPKFYTMSLPKEKSKEEEEPEEEEEEESSDVTDLQQKYNSKPKEKESKESKEIFEEIGNADIPEMLKEETKAEADALKSLTANSNWVQKFMKNENYRLHDVPADGDCFFTVIVDAFKQAGKKTTVARLREIVADSATPEIFEQYSQLYTMFKTEIISNESNIKKISEKIKDLQKRSSKVEDKSEKETLLTNIQTLMNDKKKFKNDNVIADDYSKHFKFMENVNSLEEMREKMKTSSFWADENAINAIEHKLNIKMIILSEESYKNGSEDATMKCSSGPNDVPMPTPEFYIMTSYTGDHYKLISYKDKKILKFSEIPYYIKTLIVNKCVERNAGIFHHITDFRRFQEKFGIDPVSNSYSSEPPVNSDLYDDTIHFMFYEKSADAKPGKGSGEKIGNQDIIEFKDLQHVPNWRRMLDDEYVSPFTFDGKQWQTVEHYYQASKFKKGFPDFYTLFSLDSRSEFCNDVKKAKNAGGKSGKYRKELGNEKVSLDPDFYGGRDKVERANALTAKFENPEFKKILVATKKAKLLHFIRGSEPEVDMLLMELRAKP